jgi:poly(3-hydroxybutyrate) depolymerase
MPRTAVAQNGPDRRLLSIARTTRGCSGGAELDFYIVNGGGHTWPGAPVEFGSTKSLEINASELLAEFFSDH